MEVGGLRKIGKPTETEVELCYIRQDMNEKQVKMRGGLTSDQVHFV